MDIGSTVQGNVNIENPKTQDESQIIHQTNLDNGSAESSTLGIVAGKRKKKKRKKEKHLNGAQKETDARLSQNLNEGKVAIEKPKVKDELRSLGQTQINTESTEIFADGNVIIENSKTQDEAQSTDQQKMDTLKPAENHAQGNVNGKRRKKRKKRKKAKVNDEARSEMETGSTENIFDGNIVITNEKIQDKAQSMVQNKMDICRPAENLPQGNLPGKQRKKRKKKKAAKFNEEIHSETHTRSTENVTKGNATINKLEIKDEVQNASPVQMHMGTTGPVAEGNVTIKNPKSQDEVQSTNQAKMGTEPTLSFAEGNVTAKRKRKQKKTKKAKFLDEGISHAEWCGISTCNAFPLKDAKALCLKTVPIRRKLLVLDINGLLADIVYPAPKNRKPDIKINGRAVFRRSFCHDFLKFCFQNFDVGIWSSRSKYNR